MHNIKSNLLISRILAEANCDLISKCLDLFLVWEFVLDLPKHVVISISEGPTRSAKALVVCESIGILFLLVSSAL